ncbi:D-alanyl-D-alanine carboxypeptidase/D-alanyl-D-alanine-endopeptidase [bacterium]|nr:D-alanyl-D-alanine carboxypeptidase/D-alanyl-D-alanine-endopeptidase [bacterium]
MKKIIAAATLLVVVFSFKSDVSIAALVEATARRHSEASLAFYAYDLDGDKGVCAYNSSLNMAPASTLKVLTTLTALELMGADAVPFRTRFSYNGLIENGSLKGDLLIDAAGDFTLGSRYFKHTNPFDEIAAKLLELGVKKIEGKVLLNLNGFEAERIPNNWSFDDLGNYYGASLAPFNWSDNTTFITFSSGAAGTPTRILRMEPPVAELQFENQVMAANIGYDNAYVYGAPRQYNRLIRGEIPANRNEFTIKASVPEPELWGMQCFVAQLREAGIDIAPAAVSIVDSYSGNYTALVSEVLSPTLLQIVEVTNMESNNLFAEGLLKAIARHKTGYWSREKGIEVVREFWKERGVDLSTANLYDGSGLSRFNGISTRQMVELLKYASKSPQFAQFKSTLPVAGVSGSIAGMFKGTKAEKNLMAKSGYIEKVRSYCGYVRAGNGHMVAFSIIANGYSCSAGEMRNELEKIMTDLAN